MQKVQTATDLPNQGVWNPSMPLDRLLSLDPCAFFSSVYVLMDARQCLFLPLNVSFTNLLFVSHIWNMYMWNMETS